MNSEEQKSLLRDVSAWNQWRTEHPSFMPDLTGVDLSNADLRQANLSNSKLNDASLIEADLREANLAMSVLRGANLYLASLNDAKLLMASLAGANLEEATLKRVDLRNSELDRAQFFGADLTEARLHGARLNNADLSEAVLSSADLSRADLTDACFRGADLQTANLEYATLVQTDFTQSKLDGCRIFGMAAWDIKLDNCSQTNLVITRNDEPTITVDSLDVAQFVYLLVTNAKIRTIIDTVGKKAVLILGRFTPKRKAILDAIREALRERGYVPILFDFEKPASRDLKEAVSTLAHLARFVIADLTSAKRVPEELEVIVPNLPSVPIQPLIARSARVYDRFEHVERYPSVLPIYRYRDVQALIAALDEHVIAPAEVKAAEFGLAERKHVSSLSAPAGTDVGAC